VHRVEALWTKILGVSLILLGLMLFVSPYISYTTRENISHTPLKVKREKTITIPPLVSILIIAAGIATLILATRSPRR
jgi:uncharacterized membrane protein HdeD (DUF308 family)